MMQQMMGASVRTLAPIKSRHSCGRNKLMSFAGGGTGGFLILKYWLHLVKSTSSSSTWGGSIRKQDAEMPHRCCSIQIRAKKELSMSNSED